MLSFDFGIVHNFGLDNFDIANGVQNSVTSFTLPRSESIWFLWTICG